MASRGRGETDPTEHGPSTSTGIDHDDENDLMKDLTEIKEFYRLPGICKNAKMQKVLKVKTVLNISKILLTTVTVFPTPFILHQRD